jgi:hypothetical protein
MDNEQTENPGLFRDDDGHGDDGVGGDGAGSQAPLFVSEAGQIGDMDYNVATTERVTIHLDPRNPILEPAGEYDETRCITGVQSKLAGLLGLELDGVTVASPVVLKTTASQVEKVRMMVTVKGIVTEDEVRRALQKMKEEMKESREGADDDMTIADGAGDGSGDGSGDGASGGFGRNRRRLRVDGAIMDISGYHCECREGFSPIDGNFDRCEATVAPTAMPTSPPPTPTPTLPPSVVPTHMPTGDPCASGNHECDPRTSLCVSETVPGSHMETNVHCQCLEGYIPNAFKQTECIATNSPTLEPTLAPTAEPTHLPTPSHVCESGDHDCDTVTTICAPVLHGDDAILNDNELYECICKEGFVASDYSTINCVVTSAPTSEPTFVPTLPPGIVIVDQEEDDDGTGPHSSYTLSAVVPTPEPSVLEPCTGDHACDIFTTVCVNVGAGEATSTELGKPEGFCSLPEQHLSFTFLPGSAGKRCSTSYTANQAELFAEPSTYEECLNVCEHESGEGGMAGDMTACHFYSYNSETSECVTALECHSNNWEDDEGNTRGIAIRKCPKTRPQWGTQCAHSIPQHNHQYFQPPVFPTTQLITVSDLTQHRFWPCALTLLPPPPPRTVTCNFRSSQGKTCASAELDLPTSIKGVDDWGPLTANTDISNCFYACYNTDGCEYYSYSRTASLCKLHATCEDYEAEGNVEVEEDRWVYMMDGACDFFFSYHCLVSTRSCVCQSFQTMLQTLTHWRAIAATVWRATCRTFRWTAAGPFHHKLRAMLHALLGQAPRLRTGTYAMEIMAATRRAPLVWCGLSRRRRSPTVSVWMVSWRIQKTSRAANGHLSRRQCPHTCLLRRRV